MHLRVSPLVHHAEPGPRGDKSPVMSCRTRLWAGCLRYGRPEGRPRAPVTGVSGRGYSIRIPAVRGPRAGTRQLLTSCVDLEVILRRSSSITGTELKVRRAGSVQQPYRQIQGDIIQASTNRGTAGNIAVQCPSCSRHVYVRRGYNDPCSHCLTPIIQWQLRDRPSPAAG